MSSLFKNVDLSLDSVLLEAGVEPSAPLDNVLAVAQHTLDGHKSNLKKQFVNDKGRLFNSIFVEMFFVYHTIPF